MSWQWHTSLVALVGLAIVPAGCEVRDVAIFELAAAGNAGAAGSGGSEPTGGSDSGAVTVNGGGPLGGGAGGRQETLAGSAGSVGSSASGGSAGDCGSNDDCGQGWLCEKANCAAERGVCDLRPIKPTVDYQPVCGCDGVTYWNDDIRREAGATLLQSEQCSTTALRCGSPSDCVVKFTSCARLVSRGESCGPGGQGACWLLPRRCPDPSSDPDTWQECRPPPPGGAPPPPCTDTCGAIRDGHAHQQPRDSKMCSPPP